MYSRQFLTLDEARAVTEAALAEAAKNPERPCAIAVVDPMGDIIYFVRQDKAAPQTVMIATNKAYTAARLGQVMPTLTNTSEVPENLKKYTWFTSMRDFTDPKFTPAPGGMCIRAPDGAVIGAIGIAGRTGADKIDDDIIGEAGLKALSL